MDGRDGGVAREQRNIEREQMCNATHVCGGDEPCVVHSLATKQCFYDEGITIKRSPAVDAGGRPATAGAGASGWQGRATIVISTPEAMR
jgi:hypothetical protein